VIIPCYNSEASIGLLVDKLRPVIATLAPASEIILIDDASRDGTAAVIADLARRHAEVTAVCLMRNYGQHAALLCGIRAARYDVTITMDDDLQHPPEELPRLVVALTDEVDVVYGSPAAEPHGLMRRVSSRITKRVLRDAMGVATAGKASAWRVFRTRVRDAFAEFRGSFVSIDVLLTWGTQRFTSVTVRHDPRTIGSSNYTLRKLLVHAINMMTGFTTIPLRLASWFGFALTGFGVIQDWISRNVESGAYSEAFFSASKIICVRVAAVMSRFVLLSITMTSS
jgi:undecaprenyl-phosphate 4-deoxy-4-formamido-L-arabinose transferase